MQSSEACAFTYSISLLDLLTTLHETGNCKLVSMMKYVAAVENCLAEAVLILGLNSFRVLPRDFFVLLGVFQIEGKGQDGEQS